MVAIIRKMYRAHADPANGPVQYNPLGIHLPASVRRTLGELDHAPSRHLSRGSRKIHIDGYGFHWEGAVTPVLRFLRESGVKKGIVVDLGCGGGQWLERLSREGYAVCGVDRRRT